MAFFIPRRRLPVFLGHDEGAWSHGYGPHHMKHYGCGAWDGQMFADEDFSFFQNRCPREMWTSQYGPWKMNGQRPYNSYRRGCQGRPNVVGFPFHDEASPTFLAFRFPGNADMCRNRRKCNKEDIKKKEDKDGVSKDITNDKESSDESKFNEPEIKQNTCEQSVQGAPAADEDSCENPTERASVSNNSSWKKRLSIGHCKEDDIKVRVRDGVVYVEGEKEIKHDNMVQYLVMKKRVMVPDDANIDALRVFFEEGGSLYLEAPAVSDKELPNESLQKLSLDDIEKDLMDSYDPISPLPDTPSVLVNQTNDTVPNDQNEENDQGRCEAEEKMDTAETVEENNCECDSIVILESNENAVSQNTTCDKGLNVDNEDGDSAEDNTDNSEWEMVNDEGAKYCVEEPIDNDELSDTDHKDAEQESVASKSLKDEDVTIKHHVLQAEDLASHSQNEDLKGKVIIRAAPEKHSIIQNDDGSKTFQLRLNVEGYDRDDIDVKTVGDKLTIHAKHVEEEDEGFINHREMYRSFRLPEGADGDNIQCHLVADGTLSIVSPLLKQ